MNEKEFRQFLVNECGLICDPFPMPPFGLPMWWIRLILIGLFGSVVAEMVLERFKVWRAARKED